MEFRGSLSREVETKPCFKTLKPYLDQAMKKFFASFVFAFALSAAVPQLAFAQESNSRQYGTLEGHHENGDFEPTTEGESNNIRPVLSKQDSLFAKTTQKKTTAELQKSASKKASEDEAPFNFLYYIIQRFKTSDIIED